MNLAQMSLHRVWANDAIRRVDAALSAQPTSAALSKLDHVLGSIATEADARGFAGVAKSARAYRDGHADMLGADHFDPASIEKSERAAVAAFCESLRGVA